MNLLIQLIRNTHTQRKVQNVRAKWKGNKRLLLFFFFFESNISFKEKTRGVRHLLYKIHWPAKVNHQWKEDAARIR